jgi:hypothetical protein
VRVLVCAVHGCAWGESGCAALLARRGSCRAACFTPTTFPADATPAVSPAATSPTATPLAALSAVGAITHGLTLTLTLLPAWLGAEAWFPA